MSHPIQEYFGTNRVKGTLLCWVVFLIGLSLNAQSKRQHYFVGASYMGYLSNRFNDFLGLGVSVGKTNKSGNLYELTINYSTSTMLFTTFGYGYPLVKGNASLHLLGLGTFGYGSMPYRMIPNSAIWGSVYKNYLTTLGGGVKISGNWKKSWVPNIDIYGSAGIIYGEGFNYPGYSKHSPLSFLFLNVRVSVVRQLKL
ncbi:hypothetical protein QQ054_13450 [Oscillatoria amoena NRMC-F 0135]|nr:hypothetical protein [Oscillatoria amoena NRMC-F 0135]